MTRRSAACALLFPIFAPSVAMAQSPFAPGGPLEPWIGPLPAPPAMADAALPAHRLRRSEPSNDTIRGPAAPVAGLQGFDQDPGDQPPYAQANPPPMDRNWEPVTQDEDRQTYVAATFNPALMTFGKTSGRLELAPLAAHAVFLEVSRLSLFIDDVGRTVSGTEFDIGYHLYPQGQGAHGFYLGPRYLFGSGEITEASWEFKGVGGDLGYQWVIAHHLVFNLGAGVARVNGKAEINDDYADGLLEQLGEEEADAFRSLSTQEQAFWVPMVTLGLGLAI